MAFWVSTNPPYVRKKAGSHEPNKSPILPPGLYNSPAILHPPQARPVGDPPALQRCFLRHLRLRAVPSHVVIQSRGVFRSAAYSEDLRRGRGRERGRAEGGGKNQAAVCCSGAGHPASVRQNWDLGASGTSGPALAGERCDARGCGIGGVLLYVFADLLCGGHILETGQGGDQLFPVAVVCAVLPQDPPRPYLPPQESGPSVGAAPSV